MKLQYDEEKIKSTIEKTSYDKAGKESLVYDKREVLDFDEISKQIGQQLRMGNKPRSCDALFLGEKYNYLIEFKNIKSGDLKKSKPELHEKAYDSIFQLQLYLDKKEYLEEMINKTRFVLVYNDLKGTEEAATDIASSKSIDKMIGKMKEFSKLKDLDKFPKKFGLGRLEGKLYEKIITVDVSDFNESLKQVIFS